MMITEGFFQLVLLNIISVFLLHVGKSVQPFTVSSILAVTKLKIDSHIFFPPFPCSEVSAEALRRSAEQKESDEAQVGA